MFRFTVPPLSFLLDLALFSSLNFSTFLLLCKNVILISQFTHSAWQHTSTWHNLRTLHDSTLQLDIIYALCMIANFNFTQFTHFAWQHTSTWHNLHTLHDSTLQLDTIYALCMTAHFNLTQFTHFAWQHTSTWHTLRTLHDSTLQLDTIYALCMRAHFNFTQFLLLLFGDLYSFHRP